MDSDVMLILAWSVNRLVPAAIVAVSIYFVGLDVMGLAPV